MGEHREGCGRPSHKRDECRKKDVPGYNDQGRWIDSKAYKSMDAASIAAGNANATRLQGFIQA